MICQIPMCRWCESIYYVNLLHRNRLWPRRSSRLFFIFPRWLSNPSYKTSMPVNRARFSKPSPLGLGWLT